MEGYLALLRESAKACGNCACMGLDPQWEVLPSRTGQVRQDISGFFSRVFEAMLDEGLAPAAFKPNIGYYAVLDDPRRGQFEGSLALADVLSMIRTLFPRIPVILDSKRGDIARSSWNYASEAFDVWGCDAVTVSPYMGSDSVSPFLSDPWTGQGVYVLARTSNPGARDFQSLSVMDPVDDQEQYPLHLAVAQRIATWAGMRPGTGAVVGATNLTELSDLAGHLAKASVPLLIPGVGAQGASAVQVMETLHQSGYPLELARINSSSALTHPWKQAPAPSDYLDRCMTGIRKFLAEVAL